VCGGAVLRVSDCLLPESSATNAAGAKAGDMLALRAGLYVACAALAARGARALVLADAGELRRVLAAIAAALRWPQVGAQLRLISSSSPSLHVMTFAVTRTLPITCKVRACVCATSWVWQGIMSGARTLLELKLALAQRAALLARLQMCVVRMQGVGSAHAPSEDVHKAQLGCVDCLAQLIGVQLEADAGHVAPVAAPSQPTGPIEALYPGVLREAKEVDEATAGRAASGAGAAQPAWPAKALYSGVVIEEAEELEEPDRSGGAAAAHRSSGLLDELVEAVTACR